jgi:DNA-binding transcriptional LysR family regulator
MNYLDPDLLRTFLAFVDSGSLARAAEIVGRTPSAVTSQMQRLSDSVGVQLLETSGRGRVVTPAGEELAGHARRILDLNRQALLSLKGAGTEGRLKMGATQDFAERGLPEQLRLFAASHPRLRIELRIGRTWELNDALERGDIDLALAMRLQPSSDEVATIREEMVWIGPAAGLVGPSDPLPLALLDPPCNFRNAALSALAHTKQAYWIAAESQSLSGLRAAVLAGLAVTPRTARWITDGTMRVDKLLDLPELGFATYAIRMRAEAPAAARDLGEHLADALSMP